MCVLARACVCMFVMCKWLNRAHSSTDVIFFVAPVYKYSIHIHVKILRKKCVLNTCVHYIHIHYYLFIIITAYSHYYYCLCDVCLFSGWLFSSSSSLLLRYFQTEWRILSLVFFSSFQQVDFRNDSNDSSNTFECAIECAIKRALHMMSCK